MRRSTESLRHENEIFEPHEKMADENAISRRLGELIGRHHELAMNIDSDDVEALHDMRRLRDEIRSTKFTLEYITDHTIS